MSLERKVVVKEPVPGGMVETGCFSWCRIMAALGRFELSRDDLKVLEGSLWVLC